jgi:hypothetical protein
MMNVVIPVDENKLRAFQQIAERDGTTPEAILTHLIDKYLEEQTSAELTNGFENRAGIGFFSGGTRVTGQNAEDILEAEWEPG